jgi:glycosyltransferase involved in cell wall biosynthesis
MYEYMMCGIPVIASDFPKWREVVEREACGLVVDPLDPNSIAEAMGYLMDHVEEAVEMGRRGRRAVEERYNWSTEAKRLLELYRMLLDTEEQGGGEMHD